MKKLRDLKNRILVSIGAIFLVIVLVFFSNLFFMKFVIALFFSFLAYVMSLEFLALAEKKNLIISKSLFLTGVISQVIAFFIYSQFAELKILPLAVLFFFIMFSFISNFTQIEKALFRLSTSIFGFLYISIPLGMLLPILYISNFEMQDGRYWIFYLIFVTKLTDIGAYFFGNLFGKKKLANALSPNKTIVGAIAGLVFAIGGSLFFLFFSKSLVFDLKLIEAIILAVILGIFAQFGDFCESLLKRDAKIKNSAALPGLGGFLDMADSLIFNVPILYFYLIG